MNNSPYFPHIFPVFLKKCKGALETQILLSGIEFPVFIFMSPRMRFDNYVNLLKIRVICILMEVFEFSVFGSCFSVLNIQFSND